MDAEQIEHVYEELAEFRRDCRLFVAVANCDRDRVFNGSWALQDALFLALGRQLTLHVRRLTDEGRRKKDGTLKDSDRGLLSVVRALEDVGQVSEAQRIVGLQEVIHISALVDKLVAHVKPADLRDKPGAIAGVKADEYHVAAIANVAHELSTAFLTHVRSPCDLDYSRAWDNKDPFVRHVRSAGLPVIDFSPLDIFDDPSWLAPNLRAQRAGS